MSNSTFEIVEVDLSVEEGMDISSAHCGGCDHTSCKIVEPPEIES